MSKTMKIIFTLSLVLNALLAGLFAGHMIQSHRYRPVTRFAEIRVEMRGPIFAERAKLARIMKADDFDQAAFDLQLNKYSDMKCEFDKKFMIDFNKKVQKMSVAERNEVIDKTMMRGGKHRRH